MSPEDPHFFLLKQKLLAFRSHVKDFNIISLTYAPELGEHSEEILKELGFERR